MQASMNDLEQLSQEAAKILPEEMFVWLNQPAERPERRDWKGSVIPAIQREWGRLSNTTEWLHESTEACAEIMVRELKGLWARVYAVMLHLIEDDGVEEMQAFRTAVLRALIEVKNDERRMVSRQP